MRHQFTDLILRSEVEVGGGVSAAVWIKAGGVKPHAAAIRHQHPQQGLVAVAQVHQLIAALFEAHTDLADVTPLAAAQVVQGDPLDQPLSTGHHHVAALGEAHGPHHRFPRKQPQQHRPLGIAAHQRQVGVVDRQAQQTAGAAGHHQILAFPAQHRPLQGHPFLEFEHRGGAAGELLKLLDRQALEAAVAAEQAHAGASGVLRHHQQLHHPLPFHPLRQEGLQGAGLLASELPAQQRHASRICEGEQRRLLADRQDQPCRCGVFPKRRRFLEVQAPQQLRPHHLHLSIGLDQQAAVAGEAVQGPLA